MRYRGGGFLWKARCHDSLKSCPVAVANLPARAFAAPQRRRRMIWSLALAILAPADAPAAVPADAKKIEGKWQVVTHEHGGVKMPAKDAKKLTVQIKGGKFTSREGGKLKEEGTFTLDPKANPKAIDIKILTGSDRDKEAKGIYKLAG